MPRDDLLHIAPDDLAALTNRGTVKRAQRELENKEVTGELTEAEDGTVTAKWSDGVNCTLPGGKTISDARCTCPATELCRHVVRTVLAYQCRHATPTSSEEPWNPGRLPTRNSRSTSNPPPHGRTRFRRGCSLSWLNHKPTVRFHDLACTLRFQVRGMCDTFTVIAPGPPPCIHAAARIWAFAVDNWRKREHNTTQVHIPIPMPVLDLVDVCFWKERN